MKIIISITSYGAEHKKFLTRILEHYAAFFSDCDLFYALCVNYPFAAPAQIPSACVEFIPPDPALVRRDFTWNNKPFLQKHFSEYDFIIETDDDILVPRAAVDYYATASVAMPPAMIPGWLCAETDPKGNDHLISMNRFEIDLQTSSVAGITPHNLHSAAFIADTSRYSVVADQITPVTTRGYCKAQASRTLIFATLQKVIPAANIRDKSALIYHLPRKYYPRWDVCATRHADYIKTLPVDNSMQKSESEAS